MPIRRLTCPHGHRKVRHVAPPESTFIECKEWLAAEGRCCGAWIYVVRIRGGGALVTDCDAAQVRELEDAGLSPWEILERLAPAESAA